MSSISTFIAKTRLIVRQRSSCIISSCLTSKLCKMLVILGLCLSVTYISLSSHYHNHSSNHEATKLRQDKWKLRSNITNSITPPTNISHILFGIASSSNTFNNRRIYVESWWRPNITHGHLYMDKTPKGNSSWPSTLPPILIPEVISRPKDYHKHMKPYVRRIVRMIEEVFNAEQHKDVRWYVLVDDDTVVFIDNLVEVLSKYDHRKFFYVGMTSECIFSNSIFSFDMAFGGAGYALSYPLAKAVAKNMDLCIKRYPNVFGSDQLLQFCIADMGVSLTIEKGFHQIDFHRDISGFLSTHPQSPLLTIHHFDVVEPIFPSMTRHESINHLMKAAKLDQSRLLQQSICYYILNNWTFSVSWGYSIQIYESILPPSFLHRPLETFTPWKKGIVPPYIFNTRPISRNPCDAPHFLFFDSVDQINRETDHIVTSYTKRFDRSLHTCVSNGNHSADQISKIRVLSPPRKYKWLDGNKRRECCDIVQLAGMNSLAIKLRDCMTDEIIV